MSMICYVLRVPSDLISEIDGDAELWDGAMSRANHAYGNSQFEKSISHYPAREKQAALERRSLDLAESTKRLRARYPDVFAAADKAAERTSHLQVGVPLCLEKAWDVIEHVLRGDGDIPALLFVGDAAGTDRGYGPAFLRSPALTKSFAETLMARTAADHLKHGDLEGAEKFYGMGLDQTKETAVAAVNEVFDYYFPLLTDYVSAAAREDSGLLVWVS